MKIDTFNRESQPDADIGERCRVLSFVCILLVILVHTARMPKEWMASQDMGGMDFGTVLLNFGICSNFGRLAVPMFFAMSGFWLVKNYRPTVKWWRDAVSKRAKTIFLPMLIWSVLAVFYEFLRGGGENADLSQWFFAVGSSTVLVLSYIVYFCVAIACRNLDFTKAEDGDWSCGPNMDICIHRYAGTASICYVDRSSGIYGGYLAWIS